MAKSSKGGFNLTNIRLTPAMFMMIVLVAAYSTYKMVGTIYLLIVGATANVALSGNVAVPAIINNTTNDFISNISSNFTLFEAGITIILGLIGLVVILMLFWPLIERFMPKKKEGQGLM